MGYEIKLIIGRPSDSATPEFEEDKSKPFSDGSGFEYKRDDKGEPIKTGRMCRYFQVMAELDLCKIGYDSNPLNELLKQAHKRGEENTATAFEFYGTTEGNHPAKEDRYGDKLWPMPLRAVYDAVAAMCERDDYRRLHWAKALLGAMKDDSEQLQVMFWGH